MRSVATFLLTSMLACAAEHQLKAKPENIAWGYYWSAAKPVLKIKSGDIVEIQTVSGNPMNLERAGLKLDDISPSCAP
jgi:hypothetical protein